MTNISPVILIVEDEPDTLRVLQINLKARGYQTLTAHNGAEALKVFDEYERRIDLVLVDVTLPCADGLRVCQLLREKDWHLGIIMVSAHDLVIDKVLALDMGADDYVVKPFGLNELLARVRAVLRRTQGRELVVEYAHSVHAPGRH